MLDLAIELLLDGGELLGGEGGEVDCGVFVSERVRSWLAWWGSYGSGWMDSGRDWSWVVLGADE